MTDKMKMDNPILKIDGDFWVISPLEVNSANIAVQFIKKYYNDDYNLIIYDRTSKSAVTILSPLKSIGTNLERMLQGILTQENTVFSAIGQGIKQRCFVLTATFKRGFYKTPSFYMWNGLKLAEVPAPESVNVERAEFWEEKGVHPVYKVKPIKVKAKKAVKNTVSVSSKGKNTVYVNAINNKERACIHKKRRVTARFT